MAKDATEGGARNAWQEAVIDRLPAVEALTGAAREAMDVEARFEAASRRSREQTRGSALDSTALIREDRDQ